MMNTVMKTLNTSMPPLHIAKAVEKMDRTIERVQESKTSLFKTDYLE
ncbi:MULTISPECIES: hypothetical protein [Acinetobacter]|uniref:Uncharacterized protein n=3 Tax=Moraxellaceae TaxID=468 RepID=A0A6L6GE97_9GAMM|nr:MULTISPECIES: hypothetical protein [Acinetobacter]MCK7608191.1 hypothetical protein [Acinetobacter portensis]MDY6450351.1 hypothetical protein [Acinetobacter faecalis]MDY6456572.1 hypothetical protein [Acinetobacter faecalis]MDY6459294.1 hypothetical protein [Acinetobacter faecalis]MDY6460724.1 hypothetical protein [Acinetobacter faecalis]